MAIRSIKQHILRFFKSSAGQNIEIGICIIAMLILSPVWMPIAVIIGGIEDRQKRQAADRFPCINCGKLLGTISIDLADAEQSALMQRLLRENPGVRIRPRDRTVYAICSNCETRFTYKDKLFEIAPT